MSRGIYIVANDRVFDQAIALVKSIRIYDSETPIIMIPYDENYEKVAGVLCESHGVQVYEDLPFVEQLSLRLTQILGEGVVSKPNKLRKEACWFGPFDEFLYIDTDIVVFEKIADNLNYLKEYDFICCDYQHQGGLKNIFTSKVLEDQVFSKQELEEVFNSGFWGARKSISEQDLYDTFAECAANSQYFDFTETTDQPILNYMILKRFPRRFNIVRRPGGAPGNWAGSPHFVQQDYILVDPTLNQPLQFLHWAGIKIRPGCPYWSVWEHHRYLNETKPEQSAPPPKPNNLWQKILSKVTR